MITDAALCLMIVVRNGPTAQPLFPRRLCVSCVGRSSLIRLENENAQTPAWP